MRIADVNDQKGHFVDQADCTYLDGDKLKLGVSRNLKRKDETMFMYRNRIYRTE